MDFNEQIAIVTGGAGGFGEAIVTKLYESGAFVYIFDYNLEGAVKIAERLNPLKVFPIQADISKFKEVEKAVNSVVEKSKRIDILVNNAGTSVGIPALDTVEDDWDRMMNINLKGAFFLTQLVAKHMVLQGGGKVVNVASVNALVAENNTAVYSASKAGITNLTKSLAREWARYGIRVNAVAPGYARTAFTEKYLQDEKIYQGILKGIPAKRLVTPEEVAEAVLFLLSDKMGIMTGAIVPLDGAKST
jgi:NAD(P)-dependent dehydrogenase (short-subunit alcohol dehydrogenase family)